MNTRRMALFGAVWGCLTLAGSLVQAAEEPLATLVANLKSADESARLQAIDQIGDRGAKAAEAVAPLTELLQDGSAKVRAHAVWALGAIGAAAKPAVPAMAELVKDPDETVRRQVVKAVMHIHPGPQVTIPLCIKLLQEPDPAIQARVLNAISEAGPQAVPALIEALKNEKAAYWACVVLRDMGPPAKDAVPALVEAIQSKDPEVRREALLALGAMEDAAVGAIDKIAAPAVLADEHACTAATYALGRIGRIPPEAEDTIRKNVKADDKVLSVTSLWALARVHPDDKQFRAEAGEQLIARLKDKDAFVRAAAARALASLPPAPEIMLPLWEKAMQDADATTIQYALDAFAAMGPEAVPRLIDALKHKKVRGEVAYTLGQIGPAAAPATPELVKLLGDKNEEVAREAAIALAKIGPAAKQAVPALVKILQQGGNPAAHAIVYALGRIGPDAADAEPVLTDLLENTDRKLAMVSAWALVHVHPGREVAAKTVPILMAGLQNDMPLARQGAAEALGELGQLAGQAVSALTKATHDEDKGVREAAVKALAAVTGPAAGR